MARYLNAAAILRRDDWPRRKPAAGGAFRSASPKSRPNTSGSGRDSRGSLVPSRFQKCEILYKAHPGTNLLKVMALYPVIHPVVTARISYLISGE